MIGRAVILISSLVLARAAQVVQASCCINRSPTLYSGNELQPLCLDKDVDLTKRSHLAAILNAQEAPKECTPKTILALFEFNNILNESPNVCSTVDHFLEYYDNFIDSFQQHMLGRRKDEKLPRSLRHFVIAYGMQVSMLCKKEMIDVLNDEVLMRILDADFEKILKNLGNEFRIDKYIKMANGPSEFLMSIGMALISKTRMLKTKIKVEDAEKFSQFKKICSERFIPVHDQVVEPMIKLANVGFDYKHSGTEEMTGNLLKWCKAMFFCRLVGILSTEVSHVIDINQWRILIGQEGTSSQGQERMMDANSDIRRLNYEPNFYAMIGENVYDKNNPNLVKIVTKFNTDLHRDHSVIERLSRKIVDGLKPHKIFLKNE